VTHVDHFLAEPLSHLPARRPGSIRRTSHVDMIAQGDGTLWLRGAAEQEGRGATCAALVGADRTLRSLDLQPQHAGLDRLLGRLVGRGFRGAVNEVSEPGTLASVLLSELPVAALLSGYASLYTGLFPSPIPDGVLAGFPVDICAGWAEPASFMVTIRSTRRMPTPNGPVAPAQLDAAWHAMPALAPGSMRRQRLIERHDLDLWAMFRDSYARPDGVTTVLHEYRVLATLTESGREVASCRAEPRVLPWTECPQAAASAGRLVGRPVAELRRLVKDDMVGTSTCTHLNDLLSSLSQADQLVESPGPGRAR
jgi:DUF2889 family protein